MAVQLDKLKKLRDKTGAGILETEGDTGRGWWGL